MAIDERRRHEMYLAFEELVGPEVATTMMEHLPPVGWADVATKRDLEHMAALLRGDMARLDADLRGEIARVGQRTIMWFAGLTIPAYAGMVAALIATR